MLTFEENRWNFKVIKIYSTLNIFPVEINLETGKIGMWSQDVSKWRRYLLWKVIYGGGIAHCLYMVGRLIQSTLIEPEKYFRWDHVVFHFPLCVAYSLLYHTAFCLFFKNPEEYVIIYNQLFVERENVVQKIMDQEQKQEQERKRESRKKGLAETSVSTPDQEQEQDLDLDLGERKPSSGVRGPRSLLAWPPKYALDEVLAQIFILVVVTMKLGILFIFCIDGNRPQLLYSSLPPEFQNLYSFLGLLVVELVYATMGFGFWFFSIICELLFFSKLTAQFKQLDLQLRDLKEKFQDRPKASRDTRREIWILRQILKDMKELVVFVEIFNRCFPPCIFDFKLLCLGNSMLYYFFAIRHLHDSPLLALFLGHSGNICLLDYIFLYENAFSIPEKMERLKSEFLLSAQKSVAASSSDAETRRFLAEMEREIGGLGDLGVKVGSFNTLERASTPIFVDFVVNNLVSLLVTFPE